VAQGDARWLAARAVARRSRWLAARAMPGGAGGGAAAGGGGEVGTRRQVERGETTSVFLMRSALFFSLKK